jgi:hypothetical protein
VMYKMIKSVVSFIHLFMILIKNVDFKFSRWVCSMELSDLVCSPRYLVSVDGR